MGERERDRENGEGRVRERERQRENGEGRVRERESSAAVRAHILSHHNGCVCVCVCVCVSACMCVLLCH